MITRTAPIIADRIIAFADLTGFHSRICTRLSAEQTFEFLSEYYTVAQGALRGSTGQIVKFIGDAILFLFPADDPAGAIAALRQVKTEMDLFLARTQSESNFRLKAHVGEMATGLIGNGELERLDVCGIAVNEAALLPNGEWVLSDALRKRAGL